MSVKQRKILEPLKALTSVSKLSGLSFSEKAITQLYKLTAVTPLHAIETLKSPRSDTDHQANLQKFYGIENKETDALYAKPLAWGLNLKEPEITKALVLFLDHKDHSKKVARINSFLEAIGSRFVGNISLGDKIDVGYETRLVGRGRKSKRIDILIRWSGENYFLDSNVEFQAWEFGVVIEAKVNAKLHKGQLKAYEDKSKTKLENCEFFFLTRKVSENDYTELGLASENWAVVIWYRVLRNWEKSINPEIDDFEFRQFRSTLWEILS